MILVKHGLLWSALAALVACAFVAFHPPKPLPGSGRRTARPVTAAVDAAGILYREMPLLLVSEYGAKWRHPSGAGFYLTSRTRSPRELDLIQKAKSPDHPDWRGVLYVKKAIGPGFSLGKDALCGGRFLDYDTFVICGDPALTRQARQVLARAGLLPLNGPESGAED